MRRDRTRSETSTVAGIVCVAMLGGAAALASAQPQVTPPQPTVPEIFTLMGQYVPVCCTPEAGYYNMPEIVPMSLTDMKRYLETLDYLQGMPERDLRDRTDSARSLVEQRFTWKRFTETVVREVERLSAAKGINPWKA